MGQHKSWRQYTTKDGLPGNEVFDMLQDKNGFLWMVTNQGICRFNGYEFIRPVDTSGYTGAETFVPAEDSKGRIWFSRLDWSLWMIENDTVSPWEFNHVIKKFKDKISFIDQITIAQNGTVWISMNPLGFLVVSPDGTYNVLRGSENRNVVITNVDGRITYAIQNATDIYAKNLQVKIDILERRESAFSKLHELKSTTTFEDFQLSAWPVGKENILVAHNGQVWIFNQNNLISNFTTGFTFAKIKQAPDGVIMVASYKGTKAGLFKYDSLEKFRLGQGQNILENYRVCDVLFDTEGGWWAATLDKGVFYCKNTSVDVFLSEVEFTKSNVLRVTTDRESVFAGVWPDKVWKINPKTNLALPIPSSPIAGDLWDLYFDPGANRLWRSTPLEYLDGGAWKKVEFLNSAGTRMSLLIPKKISKDPGNTSYWMSSTFGFYQMNTSTYEVSHNLMEEDSLAAKRTFAVTEDLQGNVWVATLEGLRLWKNGKYVLPPFDHPVLRNSPRDIELLQDGSIVFGFKGTGVLIYDANKNLTHLTTKNGLSSDIISKIKVGTQGEFYACTSKGLNKIYSLQDGEWKIQVISQKYGLPSDIINDLTTLDNELWIATEEGLARFTAMPSAIPMPTPRMEKFLVNNRDTIYTDGIYLPFYKNNVTIIFSSLHYRSEGEILYRYRLSKTDTTFTYSTNRQVNFADLSPDQYVLEVQAQNEAEDWSESAIWSFEIRPPWWRTWWFLCLMVALLITAGLLLYYFRLKQIKSYAAEKARIKDLELAALRAQMNPHFIFNCLGSIQHFIADNDKSSATRYLSRFAKLVRLSLHSSVDGKHTLPEEMEMLDNYLALEQMRFKGKFVYEIKLDSISEPNEISIPPMLIQPFVENAVLHGIRNRTEGGKISVVFRQDEKILEATIIDNGPGIHADAYDNGRDHKSVGMTLTGRRLTLLSDAASHNYTLENITGPDGQILGTKACVRIPAG